MYDKDNIFFKIINKQIPCKSIFENEFVLSFHDINPKADIHALVIPKKPYIDILDFTENASFEEIKGFFDGVKQAVKILDIEDGFKCLVNTKEKGGQEVFHFHMHILRNK